MGELSGEEWGYTICYECLRIPCFDECHTVLARFAPVKPIMTIFNSPRMVAKTYTTEIN